MNSTVGRTAAFVVLVVGTLLLVGRGLGDESLASVGGDEARYVMDGVFLRDALADRPFRNVSNVVNYARHYYAQYPALSLGFHPPLLPVVEVPFFWMFGVGFTAPRIAMGLVFLTAVLTFYALVARLHGLPAGWLAAALFATNPILLHFGRHILSEMPTLALTIAAAFFLDRFCQEERRRDLVAFVATSAASVYAKQLAAMLFPVYLVYAFVRLGGSRLMRRDTLIAAITLAVLVMPVVPMTLMLSSANVRWVRKGATTSVSAGAYARPVAEALGVQFSTSVLALAAIGLIRAMLARDRQALLFVLWLGASLASVMFVTRAVEPARYGVYLMPAVIALAASACRDLRRPVVGVGVAVLIVFALGDQVLTAAREPRRGAPGYEAAARFVQSQPRGTTILYSAEIDSGTFVLFIRKHDPDRRAIVLRADKVLVTSNLSRLVDDRISSRGEIYDLLRRFGVGYVVLEDRPTSSTVLNWLREETRTNRFEERFRAPIGSTDPSLAGVSISVRAFRESSAPDPAAVIDMRLPLVQSEVAVRLEDLIGGTYRR